MFNDPLGHHTYSQHLSKQIIPAIVVDNNDPKKLRRVKIRVSGIHTGIADADLPWSLPISMAPNGFGSSFGSYFIPYIGANVAVFFPEESDNDTYYLGGFPTAAGALELFAEDYPNSYGWVDAGGNAFIVSIKSGSVYWILQGGNYIGLTPSAFEVNAPVANLKVGKLNCSGGADFGGAVATNSGGNDAGNLASKTAGTPASTPNVTDLINY